MKRTLALSLAGAISLFASIAGATPIFNVANDGFEDHTNGSIYSTYANSGQFLYIASGNNLGNAATLQLVQTKLNTFLGQNITLTQDANVTITGSGGASGTWNTNSATTTISFYVVKAANAYAMYEVLPADLTGSWSTYDLWHAGYGGNGALDVSHFTGYVSSGAAPVPEPSTLILFGAGLVGVVLLRRSIKG
ncbi:PEP-CTERM sorting domain-containing protein [Geobacter sp. AOG2]|uniref:PEP-CTERM sorting domain-containing protein n=1 Tax=Geobacter sp. AOG2 TaxID=1566347 RepID=UPI001CC80A4E|nr:PEP-CTERM sorting domain-containing protein [Geobacter sp. AOG2]GFE62915.1 hypothetical protein AOG2_35040 [Geobacter sp. AOG2]